MEILTVLALMLATQVFAAPPKIYHNGKYLGYFSANEYDPDSVNNPYGRYGSKYSPGRVNNPYGRYGSKYSSDSPNNPYATGGPA